MYELNIDIGYKVYYDAKAYYNTSYIKHNSYYDDVMLLGSILV